MPNKIGSNKIGSLEYQKKVLRRLEKQWAISWVEKIAWLSGIYIWKITSILGIINIDFVAKDQGWILNIANTVHEWQTWLIWNIAKKIWQDQVWAIWINYAKEIKWWQWQWFGIQIAKEVNAQLQLAWIQKWEKILTNQIQWLWIQLWWKILKQEQWAWLQIAWDVWYSQNQLIGMQAKQEIDWLMWTGWVKSEIYTDSEWRTKISDN